MAIPNEDKKIKMSNKFNEELKKHLTRLGWTDPNIQSEFIAVLNSYMLSGTNTSSQKVITNYLQKGLDVLNIELKKIELTNNDSDVVEVNPEDVAEDDQNPRAQVESFRTLVREGRRKKNSDVKILKSLLAENKKSDDVVRKIISTKNKEKALTETINYFLQKRVLLEQGEVNKNNFRTFFSNYLKDERSWSGDKSETLISNILTIVENSSGNINAQKTVVRETDLIIERLGKVTKLTTPPQTKNSQIAFQELATLSSKLRGWSSEFYSEFINNLMQIIGSSKSGKVQSFVVNKFNDIIPKIKVKDDKKEKETKDKEDKDGDQVESRSDKKEG